MGLVKYMADEMAMEMGNKTREFYEFVLPPVDMHLEDGRLSVVIDMPGFVKKDIRASLGGNILHIEADKKSDVEKEGRMICNQRPNVIDKKIRLPVEPAGDDVGSAKYEDGILTVTVSIKKNSQDIKIE